MAAVAAVLPGLRFCTSNPASPPNLNGLGLRTLLHGSQNYQSKFLLPIQTPSASTGSALLRTCLSPSVHHPFPPRARSSSTATPGQKPASPTWCLHYPGSPLVCEESSVCYKSQSQFPRISPPTFCFLLKYLLESIGTRTQTLSSRNPNLQPSSPSTKCSSGPTLKRASLGCGGARFSGPPANLCIWPTISHQPGHPQHRNKNAT